MTLTLHGTPREIQGKKVQQLRAAGQVPGVLYGAKLKEARPVTVSQNDLKTIYAQAGESTLVDFSVGKDVYKVLIYGLDTHYVKDEILHVDFYAPALDKAVRAEVELDFKGESPAVKELGGTLVKNIQSIEVEALPANLPHELAVDISSLKTFEDQILVQNIQLPEGVTIDLDPEEIVASVVPPRSEEELAELQEKPTEDLSTIKVVGEEEKQRAADEEAAETPEK